MSNLSTKCRQTRFCVSFVQNKPGLIFVVIVLIVSSESKGDAVDAIYEHRATIYSDVDFLDRTLQKDDTPGFFKQNYDKPLEFWKTNKSEYFRMIFGICLDENIIPLQKDTSYVLNDGIYVKILFEMLTEDDVHMLKRVVDQLVLNTSRNILPKYSGYKNVIKKSRLYDYDKRHLLCLMHLDSVEIDSIMHCKNTPLYIKARLGDIGAADSLIEQYKNEKEYRSRKKILDKLFYVGDEKCLRFIASYYNEAFYCNVGKCISESIQYLILKNMRVFHPCDTVINHKLEKVSDGFATFFPDHHKTEFFFRETQEWVKRTYNVEFVHPDPEIKIFRGRCRIMSH